jgi:CIC family chloride channel protein
MDQINKAAEAPLLEPTVKAPSRFRALVRGNEVGLVLVAAVVGLVSGLLVTAIGWVAQSHTLSSSPSATTNG